MRHFERAQGLFKHAQLGGRHKAPPTRPRLIQDHLVRLKGHSSSSKDHQRPSELCSIASKAYSNAPETF